jgi:hypothetical protein
MLEGYADTIFHGYGDRKFIRLENRWASLRILRVSDLLLAAQLAF